MKQIKFTKALVLSIMILLLISALAPAALANSAEPPAITVFVSSPPEDLEVFILFADGEEVELNEDKRASSTYYRFYYWMTSVYVESFEGAMLIARSSGNEISYPLSADIIYNASYTLNLVDQTFTEGQTAARLTLFGGQPKLRQALLISMRIILTLVIEGLIFLAFGYRKLFSWMTFLIVNLITQGALNIILTIDGGWGSMWLIVFIFLELIILLVETLAFVFLLKEHKKGRAVAFALTANLASLVLGGLLISLLPI